MNQVKLHLRYYGVMFSTQKECCERNMTSDSATVHGLRNGDGDISNIEK